MIRSVENGTSKNPESETRELVFIWFLFVVLAVIVMWLARVMGPPDLMDNDQERPAAYLMNLRTGGGWIVQVDQGGGIMSKPPFVVWLQALLSLPARQPSFALLSFVSMLSLLVSAMAAMIAGVRWFGNAAGLWAGLFCVVSIAAFKQVSLLRNDPVFACVVFLSSLLLFHAITTGRGWLLFWLTALAATLTKGPLGLVLAGLGLFGLAGAWPRIDVERKRMAITQFVLGLAIFLILGFSWLAAAWHQEGDALFDRQIRRELVGHALDSQGGGFSIDQVFKPWLYLLSRQVPSGVLALIAAFLVIHSVIRKDVPGSAERFLSATLLLGVGIFCLSGHQRADHLMPLMPVGAMLAGWLVARRWGLEFLFRFRWWVLAGAGLMLGVIIATGLSERASERRVRHTIAAFEASRLAAPLVAATDSIMVCGVPYSVQFFMNRFVMESTVEEVVSRFREGAEGGAVHVLTTRADEILSGLDGIAGVVVTPIIELPGDRGRLALLSYPAAPTPFDPSAMAPGTSPLDWLLPGLVLLVLVWQGWSMLSRAVADHSNIIRSPVEMVPLVGE